MNFFKITFPLLYCITVLFFNCKTTHTLTLESTNNCNFYFYIKDEIKNELGILNDINLKFLLNKKDYTKFILSNLNEKSQVTCFNLKLGLQRLELKFNYSKFNSFEGKINFNLEDKDPIYKTIIILFYIENDKIYYLSPIPTQRKKLNLLDSFLNIYYIFFYPFGFFPNYDSGLKVKIINLNENDTKEELKFCLEGKDNKKCNLFFEKLILENNNND